MMSFMAITVMTMFMPMVATILSMVVVMMTGFGAALVMTNSGVKMVRMS